MSFQSPYMTCLLRLNDYTSFNCFSLDSPRNTNLTATVNPVILTNSTTLECETDASPIPLYFLIYKNDVLVKNTTNGSYVISSTVYTDSGCYSCHPVNDVGYGDNATLVLNITGIMFFQYFFLFFIFSVSSLFA